MNRHLAIGILLIASQGLGAQETVRPKLGFEPASSTPPSDYFPRTINGVLTGKPSTKLPETRPPEELAAPAAMTFNADVNEGSVLPRWARISLRGDAGDGVGYRRGFSYLEAMVPILETPSRLLFTDVRIVNFLDKDRWEYNLGGGYRWHSPANIVFGVNSFYDMRKTDYHFYQQGGVGFEALTPRLEFRANGYFIAGPAHRVVGDTGFVNTGTIINNNFILQRSQQTEVALTGAECEIGGRLPFLDRFAPRAYLAYYTYSAEGIAVTHGIRNRVEAQLTERISLHFQAQYDHLFQTTVTGGLAIHLGAPAYRTGNRGLATWRDVMHQRINRDVNIVIINGQTDSQGTQPVPPPPKPKPPDPT